MIPNVNYFSGGLGKLKNIGGSKFFTTPHTVQVPVEYEISSGSQGEFIACSLDGRLWLFNDKLVALKWNSNSLRMEFAASIQISEIKFIARGIDWILTNSSFFQVLDDAPYIFSEHVSFDDNFSVDNFYSFLPPVNGWQIVNNFLVRRYGNDDEAPLHSLSIPTGLYLTHLEQGIYGKDSSYIGSVSIEDYQLVIAQDYSTVANVSGLAFLDKTLYGFRLKQDSSLCPVSADTLLFNAQAGSWSNVFDGQDTSGNIFFDPFNCKALAVRDDAVNLLPEKKIFTAEGISQWVTPTRKIDSVADSFVIAPLEHDILATHLNSGLYREILHQKDLALTCRRYSDYKLSIGRNENILKVNKVTCKIKSSSMDIRLLNVFEYKHEDGLPIYPVFEKDYNYQSYSQIPVFYKDYTFYTGIDYHYNGAPYPPENYTSTDRPMFYGIDEDGAPHHQVVSSATASIFYINPLTGKPISTQFTINPQSQAEFLDDDLYYGWQVYYAEIPDNIFMLGDSLVWSFYAYTYTDNYDDYYGYTDEYKYIPISSRSNISALSYQSFLWDIENEQGKRFDVNPQLISLSIQDGKATFKEINTNILFIINIPAEYFTGINNNWDKSLGSIDIDYQSFINIDNPNEALHLAICCYPIGTETRYNKWGYSYRRKIYSHSFFVFKSEI